MSTELDRESLAVLELAREAERLLPRDPERVRQRVLAAVGVAAAVAGGSTSVGAAPASTVAGASTLPPSAPVAAKLAGAGLFGGFKLVGLASVLLLAGAGAYVVVRPKPASRVEVAHPPARAALAERAQPARVEEAQPGALPIVSVDAMPILEQAPAAAPSAHASPIKGRTTEAAVVSKQREGRSGSSDGTSASDGTSTSVSASGSAGTSSSGSAGTSTPTDFETKPREGAEPDADTTPQPATLREDLQLLSQAQRALNAGDAGRALELTLGMRSGQLSAERAALQVFALCRLGRRDEAVQQAQRFRSIAPRSPLLPRVNASCAKP